MIRLPYLKLLDIIQTASWVGDIDVCGVVDVATGVGDDLAYAHYCDVSSKSCVMVGEVCTLGDRMSDCKVGLGVADKGNEAGDGKS
jgi:hypothetical protein